jgi:hypothetical protein
VVKGRNGENKGVTMNKELKESSAIQTHINILQNIINRMASNSANSKTWSITIISAIVILLIDKSKTNIFYIAYIPLLMFFFLDCFYLGLEKYFRKIYTEFINSMETDKFNFKDVYKLQGPDSLTEKIKCTFGGIWSFSTLPFYVILGFLIFIISKIS